MEIRVIVSPFGHISNNISLFAAEFEDPEIGISGKELKPSSLGLLKLRKFVFVKRQKNSSSGSISKTLSFCMSKQIKPGLQKYFDGFFENSQAKNTEKLEREGNNIPC